MSENNSSAMEAQRAADIKVRKQDYMVIILGIFLIVVAKVVA
ncbi:hypothetical protein [Desulforamulus reducens]|nr:hypothetical protein [Desulforamulus reducens]